MSNKKTLLRYEKYDIVNEVNRRNVNLKFEEHP